MTTMNSLIQMLLTVNELNNILSEGVSAIYQESNIHNEYCYDDDDTNYSYNVSTHLDDEYKYNFHVNPMISTDVYTLSSNNLDTFNRANKLNTKLAYAEDYMVSNRPIMIPDWEFIEIPRGE